MPFTKGHTKIGGRQKGTPNKRSEALAEAIAAGQSPLEFLLEQMRLVDNDLSVRIDAAKAAAPYCHARITEGTQIHISADGKPNAESEGILVRFQAPSHKVDDKPLH